MTVESLTPKKNIPIPKIAKKGEDSEYAKKLLALTVGECYEFNENTEEEIQLAKKLKYTANKLQKDGRARFSFRKGRNGNPSGVWRVELDQPVPQPTQDNG